MEYIAKKLRKASLTQCKRQSVTDINVQTSWSFTEEKVEFLKESLSAITDSGNINAFESHINSRYVFIFVLKYRDETNISKRLEKILISQSPLSAHAVVKFTFASISYFLTKLDSKLELEMAMSNIQTYLILRSLPTAVLRVALIEFRHYVKRNTSELEKTKYIWMEFLDSIVLL